MTALVVRSWLPVRGPLVVRIVLPRLPGAVALLRPPSGGDHAGIGGEAPPTQLGPDARGRRAARLGIRGEGGRDPDPRERRNGGDGEVTPHGGDRPRDRSLYTRARGDIRSSVIISEVRCSLGYSLKEIDATSFQSRWFFSPTRRAKPPAGSTGAGYFATATGAGIGIIIKGQCHLQLIVINVVGNVSLQSGASGEGLGWVDLDFGCSTILLGQYLATISAHQPGELPKSKSTQPSPSPDAPDCTIIG